MNKEGPTYDDTLGDNVETREEVELVTQQFQSNTLDGTQAPIKFQGKKIKIGSEVTDADRQREQYLKEVQERAEHVDLVRNWENDNRQQTTQQQPLNNGFEDRPKFINSKGEKKNNGLMMMGDSTNQAVCFQENAKTEEQEEKRQFMNSKGKANQLMMAPEDANEVTVTRGQAVKAKVSIATWD